MTFSVVMLNKPLLRAKAESFTNLVIFIFLFFRDVLIFFGFYVHLAAYFIVMLKNIT